MLLLLPNLLDTAPTADHSLFLPRSVDAAVHSLTGLIAENEKQARVFLRRFLPEAFRHVPIRILNEHTTDKQIEEELLPLLKEEKWGLISDCGLPCIADPGSRLVYLARSRGIPIEAFVGPSSILLALMLSGLSAQSFAFHGYLERKPALLVEQLRRLHKRAREEQSTQLFIEAPYRSQKMLETLIEILDETTLLSIASDLTLPTQLVMTLPVRSWRKVNPSLPNIDDKPTVFLFGC